MSVSADSVVLRVLPGACVGGGGHTDRHITMSCDHVMCLHHHMQTPNVGLKAPNKDNLVTPAIVLGMRGRGLRRA